MTVRELINELLIHPMDLQVYVGKGMGPLDSVVAHYRPDTSALILSPAMAAGDDD